MSATRRPFQPLAHRRAYAGPRMISAAPFLTQIDPGPEPSELLPARLVFRRPITVLVGANGCGKSTICQRHPQVA